MRDSHRGKHASRAIAFASGLPWSSRPPWRRMDREVVAGAGRLLRNPCNRPVVETSFYVRTCLLARRLVVPLCADQEAGAIRRPAQRTPSRCLAADGQTSRPPTGTRTTMVAPYTQHCVCQARDTQGTVLFDAIERNDPSQASYAEDSFSFLNRNSGPVWARIRDELEVWYRDFPDVDGDLQARFRGRAPGQHFAAWWSCTCTGCSPGRASESRSTRSSKGPQINLTFSSLTARTRSTWKLTAFSGISEEGRHGAREAEMLDAIEGVETSDWSLQVNFDEVGSSSPRRATVRRRLETWLSAFDPV